VQDLGGNTVTSDTSLVFLTITTPAGATLTCVSDVPLAAVAGVAAFSGCNIDRASGTAYTLLATDSNDLNSATSGPITITVGAAAKVGFIQQPSSQTGGIAFASQPHVAIQDLGGNTVVGNTSPVSLTITTPSGAAMACSSANPLAAVAGVANFTGCSIDRANVTPYTLHAASTGLAAATSTSVTITVGPPAQVVFTVQPSATSAANVNFAAQPQVKIEDAGGNTVTTDNTSSVTLDLTRPSSPVGAVLTCNAASTVVVTAGIGNFTGCSVDRASTPNYTLAAHDTTDVLSGISAVFTIT
jgi:hypothetical protein